MTAIDNLVKHFGQDNAMRIYACAMIMADSNAKCAGDVEIGIRMTVGALKRIRRTGYTVITWAQAIDKLENEQDEGRHYNMCAGNAVSADIARIEQANGSDYVSIVNGVSTVVGMEVDKEQKADNAARAIAIIQHMLSEAACAHADNEENQRSAREWVAQYWATISARKRQFLRLVLTDYCGDVELPEPVRKNISSRYAPKGVKPMEFVELLARYVG